MEKLYVLVLTLLTFVGIARAETPANYCVVVNNGGIVGSSGFSQGLLVVVTKSEGNYSALVKKVGIWRRHILLNSSLPGDPDQFEVKDLYERTLRAFPDAAQSTITFTSQDSWIFLQLAIKPTSTPKFEYVMVNGEVRFNDMPMQITNARSSGEEVRPSEAHRLKCNFNYGALLN